jgi:hypothetical protein
MVYKYDFRNCKKKDIDILNTIIIKIYNSCKKKFDKLSSLYYRLFKLALSNCHNIRDILLIIDHYSNIEYDFKISYNNKKDIQLY